MNHKGAIVLCGGKSSRMGRDKATLPFGPEMMLQRVVRLMSQVVNPHSVVVVAAPMQQLPALPETVIITRDERPCRGPLEGIAAGLCEMPDGIDAVFVTSCDVPLLKPEFVDFMFECLKEHYVAVPVGDNFHHPLAAVYRPQVLPYIQMLLKNDCLRPRLLFDCVPTVEVPEESLRSIDPTLSTLKNLNYPEDYEAALLEADWDDIE